MIDSFTGKYRFLSNFYKVAIVFEGRVYPTLEHAYQAAKTLDDRERERIQQAPTPGIAKRIGQKVLRRPGWEERKLRLSIMRSLCRQKFSHQPYRRWLIETEDEELVEGNTWGDTFWGACNGVGENHLGHILMEIRAELQ